MRPSPFTVMASLPSWRGAIRSDIHSDMLAVGATLVEILSSIGSLAQVSVHADTREAVENIKEVLRDDYRALGVTIVRRVLADEDLHVDVPGVGSRPARLIRHAARRLRQDPDDRPRQVATGRVP